MTRVGRGMMLAMPGTLDGMETAAVHGRRPPRITAVSWGRMEVEAWAPARTSSSTRAAGAPGTGPKPGPGMRRASSQPTSKNSWPAAAAITASSSWHVS